MSGSCFGFLNKIAMDLAAFTNNQGADADFDDSIECYRQRLKMLRQKNGYQTTIQLESAPKVHAVEVADAEKIHDKTATTYPIQLLESNLKLQSQTDTESVSTNEPQSDPESDADKSSDENDENVFINHKIRNGLSGADSDSTHPRVGPRGGLIVKPRRPSVHVIKFSELPIVR